MDQILEKVMNFINENTMLLIIICIFLIIILVIYLIDNTIKSRKLEQEELEKKNNPEPIPTPIIDDTPKVEETPVVVEPVAEEVKEEKVEAVTETPVVEPEVVTPVETSVEEAAIEVNSNIDELLNKDYSENNKLVETIETKPVVEPVTPVVEVTKSKYTNDKKLSDIFGKKEEPKVNNIETTQDFSDELDRILKKLNEAETKIDNSLEETGDYTNMF